MSHQPTRTYFDPTLDSLLVQFGFDLEPDVSAKHNKTFTHVLDAYWIIPELAFGIVIEMSIPYLGTHKNGYLAYIDTEGIQWEHYDDIQEYVDVHGGVTFGEHVGIWSIVGFDTAHAGDDSGYSVEYIKEQIDNLVHGLLDAYREDES